MDENEIADSVSSLLELSSLRQSLQEKLRLLQSLALLESYDEKFPTKESTIEELIDEVDTAKQELLNAQNDNANREKIAKMLLLGQEAFKSIYSNGFNNADDFTGDYNALAGSEITTKLESLDEINGDILNGLKALSQLEVQYEASKKNLQDIEWKNRELAVLVHNSESACDVTAQQRRAEEEHGKTKNLVESLNKSLKELKLRKEVFQGLIHASKIDWFQDEELATLMTSLGDEINLDNQ